ARVESHGYPFSNCGHACGLRRGFLFSHGAGETQDFSWGIEQDARIQPTVVGARKGFFEKQGLDVELVLLRGMPMTVQALSAGSLHIGSGGAEPYIHASERGLDFILTGGVINGTAQFIIAAKGIKTYEDLRGVTFGTASLTGGTITVLREALKLKGLEYLRDYKLLIIAGGSATNLAALQSGQINATTVAV